MKCLRGHEYTAANTVWSTGNSGKPQRGCRLCKSIRQRLKYRDDAAYREKKKRYSVDYKAAHRQSDIGA